MTTAHADLLREGHAAFNDRDRERLLAQIADDITWHNPGDSPFAGTYQGRDQLWDQFFAPVWDSPMRVETKDVMSTDEYVTARATFVVPFGEDEKRFELFEVARVEDDELTERWAFVDRQAELDRLMEQAQGQLIGAGS